MLCSNPQRFVYLCCDEVGVRMRASAETRQKTEMETDNVCICVSQEIRALIWQLGVNRKG